MTIDQEKELISIMIKIYEDGNKVDLSDLKNYAFKRIEFCSSCPIHCYQKTYRQQIREVMKYSGKRIIFKHPVIAFKHVINTLKYKIMS